MATELAPINNAVPARLGAGLPMIPWRDPHRVPPQQRIAVIRSLELACAENPESADLRTCLAMVHAVNYDPYKSLASLEEALNINPSHFFAQLKLAELWYRLRALPKAEEEGIKALNLASDQSEYQMARAQLQETRKLINNSLARPTWTGSMLRPSLTFAGILLIAGAIRLWL
jgi:hypothetical protein